jgi:DNA-directed RNA polymerase specialized sigma24 family protein
VGVAAVSGPERAGGTQSPPRAGAAAGSAADAAASADVTAAAVSAGESGQAPVAEPAATASAGAAAKSPASPGADPAAKKKTAAGSGAVAERAGAAGAPARRRRPRPLAYLRKPPAGAGRRTGAAVAVPTRKPPALPPEIAFDALYAYSADRLLRQVRILTGNRRLAGSAVAHAFDQAWQRWPEVARDADPVGWLRASAYTYALAPWQRWVPVHRGHRAPGDSSPAPWRTVLLRWTVLTVLLRWMPVHRSHRTPADDSSTSSGSSTPSTPSASSTSSVSSAALQTALLRLPPERRRALLLYEGLGLSLAHAAAETESSTVTTASRITHARVALVEALPELRDSGQPLSVGLGALLAEGESAPPEPGRAAAVREASERGVRRRTFASVALTVVIMTATTVMMIVSPEDTTPLVRLPSSQAAPSAPDLPDISGPQPTPLVGVPDWARDDAPAGALLPVRAQPYVLTRVDIGKPPLP